jgi:hypothetical protein
MSYAGAGKRVIVIVQSVMLHSSRHPHAQLESSLIACWSASTLYNKRLTYLLGVGGIPSCCL